jgi:hypothetical protein
LAQPDEKQRLNDWRWLHSKTFKGFLEDASLSSGSFRTAGEFLCVSADIIRPVEAG